jgi:hypothetical protein
METRDMSITCHDTTQFHISVWRDTTEPDPTWIVSVDEYVHGGGNRGDGAISSTTLSVHPTEAAARAAARREARGRRMPLAS